MILTNFPITELALILSTKYQFGFGVALILNVKALFGPSNKYVFIARSTKFFSQLPFFVPPHFEIDFYTIRRTVRQGDGTNIKAFIGP